MSATDVSTELREQLRSTMREYWGYEEFRPLQERAMLAGISGRDSLVVLPTGGGKSLCYQVPALCLDGMAVVISPLISLMKDQVDALRACGVSAAFINSSLSPDEKRAVAADIAEQRLKLLYVAPERLSLQGLLDLLGSVQVSFFAIDEAHCVSMWGHDFRPHYRQLNILKQQFPDIAVHGYTATATEPVRDDVVKQLGLRNPEVLVGSFDRPNLTYRVERRDNLMGQIADVLARHKDESGIIYCITRKEVDDICGSLRGAGYTALPYHAGMDDEARKHNQEAFIEDRCRIIVATVAFGMGIDKPDVRYVIHAGLPKSLENYQQESGRAGRDGLEAECCLFYSGSDFKTWEFIVNKSEGSPDFKHAQMTSLRMVLDYCNGATCRHRHLIKHFGQSLEADCCDACDICLGDFEVVDDAVTIGQKILSSVYRQGQSFGSNHTSMVLKGSKTKQVILKGHDQLSTYGLLKDVRRFTILNWIGQLVEQDFLKKTQVGEQFQYEVLEITDLGWRLLKGEVEPRLLKPAGAADDSVDGEDRTSSSKPKTHDPHSMEGVDRDLYEALRSLRTEKANDLGLAPYMVFGDASLRDMARRRPTSEEGFLHVHGVGQKKCDDYAAEFTRLIIEHCRQHGLKTNIDPQPPSTPAAQSSRGASSTRSKGPTAGALASFEHFEAGKSVEEVAEVMGRALSTTRGYLANYIEQREITDASCWVRAADIATIEGAIAQVGPGPLKPIKEFVGDEIDYDTIRIVMWCWKNRHSNDEPQPPVE